VVNGPEPSIETKKRTRTNCSHRINPLKEIRQELTYSLGGKCAKEVGKNSFIAFKSRIKRERDNQAGSGRWGVGRIPLRKGIAMIMARRESIKKGYKKGAEEVFPCPIRKFSGGGE